MRLLRTVAPCLFVVHSWGQSPCGSPVLQSVPAPANAADTRLYDAAALAPNDVWAVGAYRVPPQSTGNSEWFAYTAHFDGQTWTSVPCPSPAVAPGVRVVELYSVDGTGPDDVWAAGWKYLAHPNNGHIGPQLFVVHWDGQQWTEVAAPVTRFTYMASSSGSIIRRIRALGVNDVRFYGYWSGDQFTTAGPATWHWDGSQYTMENLPLVNTSRYALVDVSVTAGEHWVVGNTGGGNYNTYLARNAGSGWSIVSVPQQILTYYTLTSVAAIAPNDVWVVGVESPLNPPSSQGYAVHFDGRRWTQVPIHGFPNRLRAFASNDVWAFGTTVEHWDGTAWHTVMSLTGRNSAQFHAVTDAGPCQVFAVGAEAYSHSGSRFIGPLAARLEGPQAGAADVRLSCSGAPLVASLLPSAAPAIGRTFRAGLDDLGRETGFTPGGIATLFFVSAAAATGYPCGVPIAGFGVGGGPSDLLVDPSAPFAMTPPVAWTAFGTPAVHAIAIPNANLLLGRQLFAQGMLFDPTNARAVLTAGLDLRIGR